MRHSLVPEEIIARAAPWKRCAAALWIPCCAGLKAVTSGRTCGGASAADAPKMSPPAVQGGAVSRQGLLAVAIPALTRDSTPAEEPWRPLETKGDTMENPSVSMECTCQAGPSIRSPFSPAIILNCFSVEHRTLHTGRTEKVRLVLTRLCGGAPLGLRTCGPGRLERLGERLLELWRRVLDTGACARMRS